MRVVRGSAGIDPAQGPFAVGIGIFDGVHRGHQALLRRLLDLAETAALGALVYTFDPHPARVLNPTLAPKLIEPLEQRLARLEALGVTTVVVEPFTAALAAVPAETFAREVLAGHFAARHIVVGADFSFGRGRGGNVERLALWGRALGFTVHPLELQRIDGLTASSTKVREFVGAGAMRGAALLLGRPFSISGVVLRGAGRGSRLGYGTANLDTHNELLPALGVYVGRASVAHGRYDAVVNVGYAPTFGSNALKIEAHLLDYGGGPLYGLPLSIELIDRLRDEMRFSDAEALKAQIRRDIDDARRVLGAAPAPGP